MVGNVVLFALWMRKKNENKVAIADVYLTDPHSEDREMFERERQKAIDNIAEIDEIIKELG